MEKVLFRRLAYFHVAVKPAIAANPMGHLDLAAMGAFGDGGRGEFPMRLALIPPGGGSFSFGNCHKDS
jgi:hypothetical protein